MTPLGRPAARHTDPPGDADSAATLSMPAAHFAEPVATEAPPRIDPRMSSSVGAQSARAAFTQAGSQASPGPTDPRRGLGATQPVRSAHPASPVSPTAQAFNAARSSGMGMAVPQLSPEKPSSERSAPQVHEAPKSSMAAHSSGYYAQPSGAQGPITAGPSTPVPPSPLMPAAVRVVDDPTSIPTSGEGATQVYRPRGNDAFRLVPVEPGSRPAALTPQPIAPKRSSTWAFLLGALAFLLVGFGIVAAIMLARAR